MSGAFRAVVEDAVVRRVFLRFEEGIRRGESCRDGEDALFEKMWAVLRRFPEAAAAMAEAFEGFRE